MSVHLLRTYRPVLNSFTPLRCNAFRTIESKRFMCSQKLPSNPVKKWTTVTLVGLVASGSMYWLKVLMDEKYKREAIKRKKAMSRLAVGGPFELIDGDGKLRKSEEFKGKWLFIYFGFTHCPDICPEELDKMVTALKILEKKGYGPRIQPLFITIDPERDTPEVVGKYIKEFHPNIIGLTGSKETVAKLCKTFRMYFKFGTADEDNDYIVDHTIITYLMDPEHVFVENYGQIQTAEKVAEDVEQQILLWDKMQEPTSWLVPSYAFKS